MNTKAIFSAECEPACRPTSMDTIQVQREEDFYSSSFILSHMEACMCPPCVHGCVDVCVLAAVCTLLAFSLSAGCL